MICPYCGSERIETEIAWGKSAETGNVGLKYKMMLGIVGVAQVYSDLCLDCNSIVRSYIKEDTDKNWNPLISDRENVLQRDSDHGIRSRCSLCGINHRIYAAMPEGRAAICRGTFLRKRRTVFRMWVDI